MRCSDTLLWLCWCFLDLHAYNNEVPGVRPFKEGDILGHETMGVIEGPSDVID